MKLLHIISSIDPARGGASNAALSLAAAQARNGANVGIFTYSTIDMNSQRASLVDSIRFLDKVELIQQAPGDRLEHLTAHRAAAALETTVPNYDVIHLHGVWDPILVRAANSAWHYGKPYVVSPHGLLNEWSLQQKQLKKQIALHTYGLRYLRRSLFVHALNEFEAQCIRRILEDCMIRIFPNGVFPEDYEQIPDTGLSHIRFPQLGGHPYFMFLGRLHYMKGLDILAEAFADAADRIPEVDLVIVGPDAGAENDFVRRVRIAGIEHRVHRLGPLYGKSKHEALCASLALVQPSRNEGFSLAITEALAMGKPVIISETCHFPEVAEHGAGMIVPLKVRELSRALVNLAQDQRLQDGMGRAARELVMSRYDWHRIAQDLLEAYKECLCNRNLRKAIER